MDPNFFLSLYPQGHPAKRMRLLLKLLEIRSQDLDSNTFWNVVKHAYDKSYGEFKEVKTIARIFELAVESRRASACLPLYLQKHLLQLAKKEPHYNTLMSTVDVMLKIPNPDREIRAKLIAEVVAFFTHNREAAYIQSTEWATLKKFLPNKDYERIRKAEREAGHETAQSWGGQPLGLWWWM